MTQLTRLILPCALLIVYTVGCDDQARRKNARLSRTHFLLGQDYVSKKNPDGAKHELFQALKYDANNDQAHGLLGQIFFLEGVHAVDHVERRQCLRGSAAAEQRRLANDRFRLAERHLMRSLDLAKRRNRLRPETLNYLANVSMHFMRLEQAISYSTRALENMLYANRFMALGLRGWAYLKKGDLDRAASDLRQALFHQPHFCVGRLRLAEVYFRQRTYDQAEQQLERLVDDKQCALQESAHLLGLTYVKLRRPMKAKAQFERCVSRNPNSCMSQECRRLAQLIGQ
ncbi:MAG: tetratricopeptide repeat protein [Deltaproteobacteria bacterium]|nr:tetratricopeptide repeat protein [Deltaproteobacteria bacterium]